MSHALFVIDSLLITTGNSICNCNNMMLLFVVYTDEFLDILQEKLDKWVSVCQLSSLYFSSMKFIELSTASLSSRYSHQTLGYSLVLAMLFSEFIYNLSIKMLCGLLNVDCNVYIVSGHLKTRQYWRNTWGKNNIRKLTPRTGNMISST